MEPTSSENTCYVRKCVKCEEIMPMSERVCYCGGAVTAIKIPLDKRGESHCYYNRRRLFWLKNVEEE